MKKLRKTLLFMLMFLMVLVGLTTVSTAASTETKTYGNLQYKAYSDNTITITRLLNRTTVTEVAIPATIDGKTVTTISGQFATPNQGETVALKKITIPSTVQTVGSDYYGAFENASNLEEIIVDSNSQYFCSVDGVLYSKDKTKLIVYPANKKGSTYTIPNTVTKIQGYAFAFTKNLETINIPKTVTEIGRSCFAQSSIKNVTVPESVEKIEPYLFYKCTNLTTIDVNGYIDYNAFEGCTNLTTVKLRDKCDSIRSAAFKDCTKLININLETCKVVDIDKNAFTNCTSLPKTIKITNSMKELNKSAFDSNIKIEFIGNDYIETTDEWEKCVNIKVNATQNYTEAYKVFDLVNTERKEQGLTELKLDKNLMDIAMQRAYEISVYYSHRRPEVYRWFALGNPNYDALIFMEDTVYRMGLYNKLTFSAENIAYNYTSAENVMNGWMNSTGHKNNILGTSHTTMGVGAIKTENGYFWVQIFGNDTYTKEEKRSNKTETRTIPACKSYVNEIEGCEGITLVSNNSTLNVGSTTKVKVKSSFMYSNATTYLEPSSFKWSSSNNKVLTVDQNGNVKGVSAGNANVIITMSDGNTRTVNITVKQPTIPITGVTLNKTSVTMSKGLTTTLTATINPSNTTNSKTLTWSSSNSSVATVDSTGKVTAKGSGTATITVKTSNGKTATCKVTVPAPQTNTQTNTKPNTNTNTNTQTKPSTSTNTNTNTNTNTKPNTNTQTKPSTSTNTNTNTKPNTNTQTPTKATPNVTYRTHVQNVGWQNYVKNGAMAGTSGKSLRLEGINIKLENNEYSGNIEYQTHVQNIGWQSYVKNGAMSGTSGQSLRLEGIRIKLTGDIANYYDIYYRVHCQNFGWLDWAKNGEAAGSAGYSYRLEGIEIRLVKKGGAAPGKTATPFIQKYVRYQTHVQNIGWQGTVQDKEVSGTSGQSLRLEGIKISLESQPYSGNIEYRTHVQNIGWQNYVKNGAMAGTSGKSLRLEAIQIRLTGTMAEKFDIYYRVHCQNFGWMGWAKNGQSAGSAGYSYRLEAIQICLVEKGKSAPGSTANCFVSK